MKVIKMFAAGIIVAAFLAGCAHSVSPYCKEYCAPKPVTKVHQKYSKSY